MEVYRQESAPAGAFYQFQLRPRWTVRPGLSRAGSLWDREKPQVGSRSPLSPQHRPRPLAVDRGRSRGGELLRGTGVWVADGPGGSPLADLCVRRVDGATEFLCVERSERGDALAHQALKGAFGAAVSFRSMTAAQILADPVLLDNASRVIGHAFPSLPAHARDLAERV